MLFLVQGDVRYSTYGNDDETVTRETRLVEAKDETDAEKKFKLHFEAKSSEYSCYYFVECAEAHELIT